MEAIKEKNQKKVTSQTHCKSMDVLSKYGIAKTTFYRDIKFLGIELIKDEDNVSWISNEDVERVILLRKHIEETGRRKGFSSEKVEDLIIEEPTTENIIKETPETLEITMTQSTEPIKTESMELATTESTGIATTESGGIATTESAGIASNGIEEEIYVEPEKPTNNVNLTELVRNASKLKAREAAMPALLTRAIADKMTEEDLPSDLKQKVQLAREAANPKFTPSEIADEILNQYRKGLIA